MEIFPSNKELLELTFKMKERAFKEYLELAQKGLPFQERKKIGRKIKWCNEEIKRLTEVIAMEKKQLSAYELMWQTAFRVLDEAIV